MTYLLLGGGGVLGSGFREVLLRRGENVSWLRPAWQRVQSLEDVLAPHLQRQVQKPVPLTVVWAAGVGAVGAGAASMRAESDALGVLVALLAGLPQDTVAKVSMLFASSAGAIYAGHGSTEVNDASPPSPTSEYGFTKLAQEAELAALAARTGCRVLACRYSNVYGLAGGRLSARGLVSTAVRASRLRQPMTVYVSPDSRRDYVYAPDAAAIAIERLEQTAAGFHRSIVCEGAVRSVAEVLAVVGRVSGRRVPATYAERPETSLQPRVLRFRPAPVGAARRMPMEAAVHRMARAPISA